MSLCLDKPALSVRLLAKISVQKLFHALVFVLILLFGTSVFVLRAQDSAAVSGAPTFPSQPFRQQQQAIPFDADGKVMRMTWEMEKYFSILRNYPDLYEARLYQSGDTTYLLELTQVVGGKVEREIKTLSVQEFSRIRYETSEAVRSFGMYFNEERTAVFEDWLIGGATGLFSLAQGVITQGFLSVQIPPGQANTAPSVWWIPPVLNTGVYLWAVNQPWYNRPASTLWLNGLVQGTAHGWAMYLLTAPQTFDTGAFLLTGMTASSLEAIAALALSHLAEVKTSQAQLISSFAGSGLSLAVLFQLTAGAANNRTIPPSETLRGVGISALAGAGLGIWLGNLLGKSPTLTGGDALVSIAPVNAIGSAPLTILTSVQQNTTLQVAAGVTAAGVVGGYVLGNALVQGKDFSFLQGQVTSLGTWLGGYLPNAFLNGAINSAILNGQVQQAQSLQLTATIASFIGGVAGFTIPYLLYAKEAEDRHSRRLVATGAQALGDIEHGHLRPIPHERTWLENLAANTDVQFSPLGLLPLMNPTVASGLGLGALNTGAGMMNASMPIMTLRTTFPAPKVNVVVENED